MYWPFRLRRHIRRLREDYETLAVLLKPHRRYWPIHVVTAVVATFGMIPSLAIPLVVKYYIDSALGNKSVHSFCVAISAYLLIHSFVTLVSLYETLTFRLLGLRALRRLQLRVFSNLLRMPPSCMGEYTSGDLLQRVLGDTTYTQRIGGQQVASMLAGVIRLVLVIPLACSFSWQLTVVLVPFMGASVYLQRILQRRRAMLNNVEFRCHSTLNTAVYEQIANHSLCGGGALYRKSMRNFYRLAKNYALLSAASAAGSRIIDEFPRGLASASMIVVWVMGGYLHFAERLTLGALLGFQTLLPMFSNNLHHIISPFLMLRAGRPVAERLNRLMADSSQQITEPVCKKAFHSLMKGEDVSFRYSVNGCPVLEHVCLEIPKGECVCLRGPNGSGKSTMLKLLMGQYQAHAGRVTIDGVDVTRLSRMSRKRLFGYAPQEVCLFSGTVRHNIEVSCDIASHAFRGVSEAFALESFARSLPNGWDTDIGERGCNLSAGQKRLIVTVRVLASEAPILLLDEAGANLDQDLQHRLEEYLLHKARQGSTIIVTSHDIAFLPGARSLYLDNHNRREVMCNRIPLPTAVII